MSEFDGFAVKFTELYKNYLLPLVASIRASPGGGVKLPCRLPPSVLHSFNLTWRFCRSDPVLSVSVSGLKSVLTVWDQWKPHVSNGLSARRGLQLHGLKPEHQGTYTCEVSTPEGTYVTWTDVTVTEGEDLFYMLVSACFHISRNICDFLHFLTKVKFHSQKM